MLDRVPGPPQLGISRRRITLRSRAFCSPEREARASGHRSHERYSRSRREWRPLRPIQYITLGFPVAQPPASPIFNSIHSPLSLATPRRRASLPLYLHARQLDRPAETMQVASMSAS